nr:MAG TPA: hypothetical protein [Caudoviricetes sp.]
MYLSKQIFAYCIYIFDFSFFLHLNKNIYKFRIYISQL